MPGRAGGRFGGVGRGRMLGRGLQGGGPIDMRHLVGSGPAGPMPAGAGVGAGPDGVPKVPIRIDLQLSEEQLAAMTAAIPQVKSLIDSLTDSVRQCRAEVQGLAADLGSVNRENDTKGEPPV